MGVTCRVPSVQVTLSHGRASGTEVGDKYTSQYVPRQHMSGGLAFLVTNISSRDVIPAGIRS
jgi:hypothetical protein